MGASSDSSASASSEEELKKKRKKSKHDKKKKSSKEKKKDKKHAKKKKSYRRDSSSSESESSGAEEWVEAGAGSSVKPAPNAAIDPKPNAKPKVEDSDNSGWDNIDSFIPTFSSDKRKKRETKKEWERLRRTDRPGQHSRELNPYWKDGGTGLPSEEAEQKSSNSASAVGDGGLTWLRRAYQRAKEQAKEENKSLEEVAAERWGSLSNFYVMLEEAERKASGKSESRSRDHGHDHRRSHKSNFKKPTEEIDEENEYERRKDSHSNHHQSDYRDRRYEKTRRENKSGWRKEETISTSNSKPSSSRRHSEPNEDKSNIEISKSNFQSSAKPEVIVSQEKEDPVQDKGSGILDDKEMNVLSAKILKAELMGNKDLAQELKSKLELAKIARDKFIKGGGDFNSKSKDPKIITKVIMENRSTKRSSNKPGVTHEDGKRVRYFADDDKKSLQSMFHSEKTNTAENENELFLRLAGKGMKSNPNDDYDLDDFFTDKASSSKSAEKERERGIRKIVEEEKSYNKTLENCEWCFDGNRLEKNIIISIGQKSYLAVPPYQSLTEGHCIICPMSHVSASTELDEDVWNEMQKFRRSLVQMFKADDKDVVIFENAIYLKRLPHMYLECVPLPKEVGELAPIYFKKAIQECETEWSQNKKLIDLRNKDVRRGVPKGLPYFSVDFGLDSGFAHVIEDEQAFPRNFAQEIIGGMMELDHTVWRKQTSDNFKVKRDKVMNFLKEWEPYDWTKE